MASKKLSPEAQRRAATRTQPVVAVKSKGPLSDPAEQKRFGISGPVSSNEMNRIKDAQKLRKDTLAKNGTYYSAYDSSLGNTEQAGYNANKTDLTTNGTGSGGRNPLNDYTRQLQALLTGGGYAAPYDELMNKFQGLFDQQKSALSGINTQAGNTINSSMDSLQTMLQGQTNPYADLKAEAVTPTAQLSSFLQAQNVGDQQTQDYAQVLNAQNAGSAGAFNNLASVLRSMASAGQQGAITDVGVQRDASMRQLANSNAAAGINLQQSSMNDQRDIEKLKTTQQNSLMQQLMAAIAKGGVPKKGKLF
jgi:hypothetical protein